MLPEEDNDGVIDDEEEGDDDDVVCADTILTDGGDSGVMTCNNPKPNIPTKIILVLSCTSDTIFMIMSLLNLAIDIIKWVKYSNASVKIWLQTIMGIVCVVYSYNDWE
jgi:hypothetical protein